MCGFDADACCAQEPPPAPRVLLLAAPVITCTAAEERRLAPANPVPLGATAAQASAADTNTVRPASAQIIQGMGAMSIRGTACLVRL